MLAALLRMLLDPVLHFRLAFGAYFIPIMLAAWYYGSGPALLATGLATFAVHFSIPWFGSQAETADVAALAINVVAALFSVFLITELRQAREEADRSAGEIKAATARMRTILANISDGFCAVDAQWRCVYVNERAARLTRRTPEELVGKNLWEVFPETRSSKAYVELHRALAEQAPVHFEEYSAPFDLWFEVDGYPSSDGLSVFARDITARKRDEEARLHLAAIVESSEDAIISTTLDGVILSWNPGAEKLYGYTASEMIGRPISTLVPPDRRGEMPGIFGKVQPDEAVAHYETERLTKDSRRIHVSLTVSPVKNSEGRIIAASAVARDITDRKQAEQERVRLLALEQQTRRAAEHAAVRIARIQAVTAALSAARTPGDVSEVVIREGIAAIGGEAGLLAVLAGEGREPQILTAGKYPPQVLEEWRRLSGSIWETPLGEAARTGEPVFLESTQALEERYPHLTGLSHPIGGGAQAALPLKTHGRTIGAMWLAFAGARTFSQDDRSSMTALAQQCAQAVERARLYESEQAARAAAERASRLKDEFLATLSHELRTPLTAILGWARMLGSPDLDADTRERAVEAIQRNAKAQARLIEDLLDVSRIITGKLRLEVRPLDLHQLIQAAVEVLLPTAESKGIRLQQVLDPDPGTVLGDAQRLQQVVWNLLSNAIKFTPKGGRIMIVLSRIDSHVEITLSDTGKGISPDFLPYVFDRFRQADSSAARTHEGLGLGLAIVRHLVELHGGTARADSPGEGRGATFSVRLPLAPVSYSTFSDAPERVHPTAAAEMRVPSPSVLLGGLHVLVVDDEADTRDLLSTVLTDSGAKVTAAPSTAEALRALNESRPDILVADIGMPGEDGYVLIRKLRALEAERGQQPIPALALTAYARVQDRLQALEAGYQVHLAKPIEPTELVLTIAGLLRRTATAQAVSAH